MSRRMLYALLVLLLVVLAPYTVLPPLLESVIARTLQDQLALERAPEVELRSDPPPKMYVGSFSQARVSAEGVELSGVSIENVVLEIDPFDLNLLESAMSGTVSTAQPLSGRLHVELSEASALRLAQAGYAVPTVQDVELEEHQILQILSGEIESIPLGLPAG
jgi:hypothetical protein